MGQFDNLRSVTMLFTGAFLVSLGVIGLLNIEVQSRSNHGTKIRNENMFEVLGRKISQMVSTLRERNAYRRSIIYHLLISENTTRVPMRKLQHFIEDSNSIEDMIEHSHNQTYHRLRHKKKIRRLTELRLKQKSNSSSRDLKLESDRNDKHNSNNYTGFVNNIRNRTVQWFQVAINSTGNGTTREKMGPHQNCYTTNDVLQIIAITCLVNFIFWFMIISCVNIFTRNKKIWKSDSCESLTSIGSGSEYELDRNEAKKSRSSPSSDSLKRHNLVQDYVNSLKMEAEEVNHGSESNTLCPDKSNVMGKSSDKKNNIQRWKHRKFHLPNIFFDMISLDNIQPINEKKIISQTKTKKYLSSLSMEDLIF